MLWPIFVTYIITHRGLGGFSGLINGLIAAVFGALSMLMSEPTVKTKQCKEDMYVCPINRDITRLYITLISEPTNRNSPYVYFLKKYTCFGALDCVLNSR